LFLKYKHKTMLNITFERKRLSQSQNRLSQSENRLSQSQNRLRQSENRLSQSENRLSQSENRLRQSENRLSQSENRLSQSENRVPRRVCDGEVSGAWKHFAYLPSFYSCYQIKENETGAACGTYGRREKCV
jgi:exonuclease VII large subunit